ncbi:MAG TPA: mandelate racemase/muconate lactonizing enzyme family protein [Limnochordia bacterium]|nr:mandelate racemase/muconate lactonizing enzyme family protein [Limnochordia bacterium]
MKIRDVQTALYRVPPHRPIHDAIQQFEQMELITVALTTESGARGLGFTYTIGRGGLAVKSLLDTAIVPLLLGEDALSSERIWEKLWWELHWVGRSGIFSLAQSAVDIALWDLKARALNVPLARLLGGYRERVPAYNTDGGWLNHTVEQLVAESVELVARGFSALKIKVGKDRLGEDVERLEAVRKAIGPGVGLMVDANMRFTAAEAIRRGRAYEPFDLGWFEEPLEADDVGGHVELQRHLSVPIAVGESLYNRYAFSEYVRCGGARILQPDACRLGGVTEWLRTAALAHAHNMHVAPHFVMELHVHLAAAVPNARWVEYIPFLDRVVQEPLRLKDGHLEVPDRPGHGIHFDWPRLESLRVA